MFQKPFRVKTRTTMKGSDRKKLRVDIEKQFPSLTSAQVAVLIPGKGDMSQEKIVTHADENVLVYRYQENPIFFELFKQLFPSVYTLWQFPDMLPVFTTYLPVFEKLRNGADLMLPGVVVSGEHHPKMFGNLRKGDLCLVRLKGNMAPVMLGETLLSGEDMYMSNMRGKGVRTIHIFQDHLWEMGDKSQPPYIPEATAEADSDSDDGKENNDNTEQQELVEGVIHPVEQLTVAEGGQDAAAAAAAAECDNDVDGGVAGNGAEDVATTEGAEASENLGVDQASGEGNETEAMDNLLEFCFKCAIKGRVNKSDLPLLTSSLLKGYMQPFCPPGKHLDLKKSSHKKFSKFLLQMQKEGFIRLKEVSRGVDAITEIDRSHLDLRGFTVPETVPEESGGDCVEERFQPPQVTEVLCVTAATLPLLSPHGYTKSSTLTAQELRQVVTDYVKANNLKSQDSKEQVLLDPILAHLALTKSEGDKSHLTWNTLFTRIVDKLQPGYLIQYAGRAPILKKGKVEPIKVDVEKRGSKKVTVVQNLEAYGIDPRQFAQMVQRRVAGSASVIQSEQKNRGQDVQVQGNQIEFIAQQLLETYKIPRKYVQGVEKAGKSKRT